MSDQIKIGVDLARGSDEAVFTTWRDGQIINLSKSLSVPPPLGLDTSSYANARAQSDRFWNAVVKPHAAMIVAAGERMAVKLLADALRHRPTKRERKRARRLRIKAENARRAKRK